MYLLLESGDRLFLEDGLGFLLLEYGGDSGQEDVLLQFLLF